MSAHPLIQQVEQRVELLLRFQLELWLVWEPLRLLWPEFAHAPAAHMVLRPDICLWMVFKSASKHCFHLENQPPLSRHGHIGSPNPLGQCLEIVPSVR